MSTGLRGARAVSTFGRRAHVHGDPVRGPHHVAPQNDAAVARATPLGPHSTSTFARAHRSASHGGSVRCARGARPLRPAVGCAQRRGHLDAVGDPRLPQPGRPHSRGHKPITTPNLSAKPRTGSGTGRSFIGFEVFALAAERGAPGARRAGARRLDRRRHHAERRRLHAAAGMRDCLDLHGMIDAVECLDCGDAATARCCRSACARPREWAARRAGALPAELRADGDAELTAAETAAFSVPSCAACGGARLGRR